MTFGNLSSFQEFCGTVVRSLLVSICMKLLILIQVKELTLVPIAKDITRFLIIEFTSASTSYLKIFLWTKKQTDSCSSSYTGHLLASCVWSQNLQVTLFWRFLATCNIIFFLIPLSLISWYNFICWNYNILETGICSSISCIYIKLSSVAVLLLP